MGREVVHHHCLPPPQGGSQKVLNVGFKDFLGHRTLKVAIEGPMPSKLMLESSVVFVPLFLGVLKKALCPGGE
jgi:hypothetical protein